MSSDIQRFDQPASNELRLTTPTVPFGGAHEVTFHVTGLGVNTFAVEVCLDGWIAIGTGLVADAVVSVSRDGVFVDGTRKTGPGNWEGVKIIFSDDGTAVVHLGKALVGM